MTTTAEDRFNAIVEAERARLRALANGEDWYFLQDDFYIPDGPPRALLPPSVEPPFTMAEFFLMSNEQWSRENYMRSGRYLGITTSQEEAAKLDKYRFARCFLPDGKLPWEV